MREGIPIGGPKFWRRYCRTVPTRGIAFSRTVSEQRCLISIPHSFPICEGNILKHMFCSSAHSLPQQYSSSGDLLPEMMESETPPHTSPPHKADDPEVSSWRISPDPRRRDRPEDDSSVARGPGCSTPRETNNQNPGLSDIQPDIWTGLLRKAPISEEHRTLMGMVIERISSEKSGLNEAFTSLLRGFEVCNVASCSVP